LNNFKKIYKEVNISGLLPMYLWMVLA